MIALHASAMAQSNPLRIAITTGGGDAPGLNAVIRAVVVSACKRGWECHGIRDGYNGILNPRHYPSGGVVTLGWDQVRGIAHLGGTMLGTTNKGDPTHYPVHHPDGSACFADRTGEICAYLAERGFDALLTVGGDGAILIADALRRKGMRVIAVPKTIDNDLDKTCTTFGFDTAVNFAVEAIDRLHSTAESHERIMVVEVMGRYAGWIALHAGIAGGAHAILIPEIPYDIDKVVRKIRRRDMLGRRYAIVVVAEGAIPVHGAREVAEAAEHGHAERLGGIGERVACALRQSAGKDVRTVVLGHLLRGGSPSAFDRLAALRFGAAAVRALELGLSGVMVSLAVPEVVYVPLEDVAGRLKSVPKDGDTLQTARDLGICIGD